LPSLTHLTVYYSGRSSVNAEIQALKIDIGILRTTISQDCKICPTQTILIHNLLREVDLLKKTPNKRSVNWDHSGQGSRRLLFLVNNDDPWQTALVSSSNMFDNHFSWSLKLVTQLQASKSMESKIEKGEKVASFFLDLWWMSEYKNCGIYFRTRSSSWPCSTTGDFLSLSVISNPLVMKSTHTT